MLREIFGTKTNEASGIRRKLHIEDMFGFYRQLDIVNTLRTGDADLRF